MNLSKKSQKALLSGTLVLLPVIVGFVNQVHANAEIPIEADVCHVRRSDGSHKTYFNIMVGNSFCGKLPDDIASITVIGPNGELPIDKSDFNYSPRYRVFWSVQAGFPQIGKYEFKLASGDTIGAATDTQAAVISLPIPDVATFTPADADTVSCPTPTFRWSLQKDTRPLYYQLQIIDSDKKDVYRSDYVKDMFSIRIPPDVLAPESTYRWRVVVADAPDWIAINNRSRSKWMAFSRKGGLNGCSYEYSVPEETDDGWEVVSLKDVGISPEKISEMMVDLLSGNFQDIHSVLIVKNGKLAFEEYFYGYTRHKPHSVMSVTKSVTSLLIGIAMDQNKIPDVDVAISEYFPSHKDIDWDGLKNSIRLKDVLRMAAGLDWNDWKYSDTDPRSSSQAMIRSDDWTKFVLDKKVVYPPGEKFVYSNGLSMLLGEILKYATGEFADKFAAEYLFEPLGISDFNWQTLSNGATITAWGLKLRPRDMAKIGHMMLNGGKWKGKQVVSLSWVKESTKTQIEGDLLIGSGYGYQWWLGQTDINDKRIETFYAAGKGGQYIFICPALELVVIVTSKPEEHSMGELKPQIVMVNYILPAMLPPPESVKSIQLDPNILNAYVGDYECKRLKLPLTIYKEADGLCFRTNQVTGELLPTTETEFYGTSNKIGDFRAKFFKDKWGKIDSCIVHVGFGMWQFDRTR